MNTCKIEIKHAAFGKWKVESDGEFVRGDMDAAQAKVCAAELFLALRADGFRVRIGCPDLSVSASMHDAAPGLIDALNALD
jgi:hypothetical protein